MTPSQQGDPTGGRALPERARPVLLPQDPNASPEDGASELGQTTLSLWALSAVLFATGAPKVAAMSAGAAMIFAAAWHRVLHHRR